MSEPKTKKPRKSKKQPEDENIQIEIVEEKESNETNDIKEPSKKRGRKPKGGKLIPNYSDEENKVLPLPNIILHLKCSNTDLSDYNTQFDTQITDPLSYKPLPPPEIMTYNDFDKDSTFSTAFSKYESVNNTKNFAYSQTQPQSHDSNMCKSCSQMNDTNYNDDATILMKDITMKLKNLRIQFFKNTLNDKKSACFWCTYEFDSPPCYIPKQEFEMNITGYGSFCRPECAVGFLMKESLDDSTKFERYHLLNRIYSKVYGFKKNIKPAPDPHYLLDKFYGSLTIQEYRKLLNSAHMLLVLDKPLTRILPELHEDNEEFILNIYGTATEQTNQKSGGMYKVKRQSDKQQGQTKSSIMKNNFGITN